MLELYHNAFSSCSQKVRTVLGEKGLEWKSHDIDRVLLWNRSDLGWTRLSGFRIQLLDEQRKVVWEQSIKDLLK